MHVLSVGSSVVDLFVEADKDFFATEGEKIIFNLGDKVPTDIKRFGIGGNGSNVAVALTRLEIPSSFYTYLGNDSLSRDIEEGLRREGVEVMRDKEKTDTPPLSIIFDFASDRIIFSHHQKKQYGFDMNDAGFDFIYLTSIGDEWEPAYHRVLEYSRNNNIPIAFSPGSHQIDNFNETAKEVLAASKIFFGNKEEAEIVLGLTRGEGEMRDLLRRIKQAGPETVSITDAENGGYAIDSNGTIFHIEIMPGVGPEKTGAGDSYASGFFAAILYGKDIKEAMLWGTLNAHFVTQKPGAQNGLLTKAEMEKEAQSNNIKIEVLE